MGMIALEVGQVLMSNDFMDWEVVDGNVPREVAWEWMFAVDSRARVVFLHGLAMDSAVLITMKVRRGEASSVHEQWLNHAGVVVLVPSRDMKMALAIRRVDDKFQLLGRQGG